MSWIKGIWSFPKCAACNRVMKSYPIHGWSSKANTKAGFYWNHVYYKRSTGLQGNNTAVHYERAKARQTLCNYISQHCSMDSIPWQILNLQVNTRIRADSKKFEQFKLQNSVFFYNRAHFFIQYYFFLQFVYHLLHSIIKSILSIFVLFDIQCTSKIQTSRN